MKSLGPRVKLTVRVPEDLHRRVAAEAKKRGVSINQLASIYLDLAASTTGPRRKLELK